MEADSMKTQSQCERVLLALMRYPRVSVIDFLAPVVIDGGRPITRLAARIRDLRSEGYDIEHAGVVNGCASYRLADQEVGQLFDPRETTMARSHWQDAA